MRFASVPQFNQDDNSYFNTDQDENDSSWERFGAPVAAAGMRDEIAMSRGEARNIINRTAQEALRGSITPQAFVSGLQTISEFANSPDMTRRAIRNTLATPGASTLINNPEILRTLARQKLDAYSGMLQSAGVNPDSLNKHIGPGINIIQQLKKDNLLRSNVSLNEIRDEVQRPLYGALMDWTRENLNNPRMQQIIGRSSLGRNVQWGPRGFVPIAAGFNPSNFGVRVTPQAAQADREAQRRLTWENSPSGRARIEQERQYAERFKRDLESLNRQSR
jgi:hypothetical protein